MIEYIYHITMNTGHMRKTYPDEVDKKLYFVLNRIYREALTEQGARLFEKYILKGSKFEYGAIFTLFGELKNKEVNETTLAPILTTVSTTKNAEQIWKQLYDISTLPLKTKRAKKVPEPCIIDVINIGGTVPNFMESLEWTGDMARVLGWMTLCPEVFR